MEILRGEESSEQKEKLETELAGVEAKIGELKQQLDELRKQEAGFQVQIEKASEKVGQARRNLQYIFFLFPSLHSTLPLSLCFFPLARQRKSLEQTLRREQTNLERREKENEQDQEGRREQIKQEYVVLLQKKATLLLEMLV